MGSNLEEPYSTTTRFFCNEQRETFPLNRQTENEKRYERRAFRSPVDYLNKDIIKNGGGGKKERA